MASLRRMAIGPPPFTSIVLHLITESEELTFNDVVTCIPLRRPIIDVIEVSGILLGRPRPGGRPLGVREDVQRASNVLIQNQRLLHVALGIEASEVEELAEECRT